jgi:glycosyltransferase involved in cell wall biosynthesis
VSLVDVSDPAVVSDERTIRSVCIAVPTFRRLELLGPLLDDLAKQVVSIAPRTAQVLIIDNDRAGAARDLVLGRRAAFPCELHYANVRTPGLSAVRNYSLEFALDSSTDALVMIDDDERPGPEWLRTLIDTANARDADVVSGPVAADFAVPPPTWIVDGAFFESARLVDGASMSDCYSNDALLRIESLRRVGLRFAPELGLAGGEDQLFFRQMVKAGCKIVYASAASVTERIPPERTALRYLLRRSLRRGTTLSICDVRIHGTPGIVALRFAKSLAAIAYGLGSIVFGFRKVSFVNGACEVARGLGMMMGLFGRTVFEYADGHGTGETSGGVLLEPDLRSA